MRIILKLASNTSYSADIQLSYSQHGIQGKILVNCNCIDLTQCMFGIIKTTIKWIIVHKNKKKAKKIVYIVKRVKLACYLT